jgi:hypothetical protein
MRRLVVFGVVLVAVLAGSSPGSGDQVSRDGPEATKAAQDRPVLTDVDFCGTTTTWDSGDLLGISDGCNSYWVFR